MLVGYARISTGDQTLALQEDALKAAGCDRVFTDTISTPLPDALEADLRRRSPSRVGGAGMNAKRPAERRLRHARLSLLAG